MTTTGQVRRVMRERRRRRLGLCGVCRHPVRSGEPHRWIRGHVFHQGCTRGLA